MAQRGICPEALTETPKAMQSIITREITDTSNGLLRASARSLKNDIAGCKDLLGSLAIWDKTERNPIEIKSPIIVKVR